MAANRLMTAARLGTNTTFTLAGASQATPAFGTQTYLIRCANLSGVVAYIKVGDGTPTASAADVGVPNGTEAYFVVTPGQKCAVFGASGTFSVTEMV
jgi:hypothetical protein